MIETQEITSLEIKDNKTVKYDLASLIPYTGTFIIFLGVVRLTFYYEHFGINIINFIELSEVITSFLDIILSVILYLVGFLVVILPLTNNRIEKVKQNEKWEKIYNEISFKRRLKLYLIYSENVFAAFFTLALMVLGWHFYSVFVQSDTSQASIWVKLLFLLLFLLGSFVVQVGLNELYYKLNKEKPSNEKRVLLNAVFFLFLSIGFIYLGAYTEAKSVKENKKFVGVVVKTEDSSIISDSSNYYIGKTSNFLFIHNQAKGTTNVIPTSKVTELSFPSNSK